MNPEQSHPLTQATAIAAIKKGLKEKFDNAKLTKCLVSRCQKTGEMNFNTNCFQACLHKLKWKKENNEFHYFQSLANKHIFSYEAVNEIIKRITQDDNFLMQAKKSFNSK